MDVDGRSRAVSMRSSTLLKEDSSVLASLPTYLRLRTQWSDCHIGRLDPFEMGGENKNTRYTPTARPSIKAVFRFVLDEAAKSRGSYVT